MSLTPSPIRRSPRREARLPACRQSVRCPRRRSPACLHAARYVLPGDVPAVDQHRDRGRPTGQRARHALQPARLGRERLRPSSRRASNTPSEEVIWTARAFEPFGKAISKGFSIGWLRRFPMSSLPGTGAIWQPNTTAGGSRGQSACSPFYNHISPLRATSSAWTIALALLRVSSYSREGTESATTPPPAWK